jgi:dTDP-4-dehydrorhamnose 3,5-epimerase
MTIDGAFVLEPERHEDERGSFARTFCVDELTSRGLDARIAQINTSYNARRGTLRGMHYQTAPDDETKLVRCTRGSIYDVVVDLRPGSSTFGRWASEVLTADNGHAVYVPRGLAHGFLTLEDATEVEYVMSTRYAPDSARGVRFDDPAFSIQWPFEPTVISERDRTHQLVQPERRAEA